MLERRARFSLLYYLWVFGFILLVDSLFFSSPQIPDIAYSEFLDRVSQDQVDTVVLAPQQILGEMKTADGADTPAAAAPKPAPTAVPAAPHASANGAVASDKKVVVTPEKKTPWRLDFASASAWFTGVKEKAQQQQREREDEIKRQFTVTPLNDPNLVATLQAHGVDFRAEIDSHWLRDLFFNWILPFGAMFLIWGFVMQRMGGGPSALKVGKSKAKIYAADEQTKVRFTDVAGVDEAVEEVHEIVSFLKEPAKYTRLGAKLPTGVLLVGPPGTGKTLLARAIAGEAGVPFFSLSGSDFVEMFVGVGAARVRDMFQQAEAKAPCIIFIDELDALGKTRGTSIVGGHDEREQTLNALLVEMDGFSSNSGVIVMAATNRPETLDPALLRPGRFDRHVLVDRPDVKGREKVLEVHVQNVKLDSQVNLKDVAGITSGFVGADLANLVNEAALLAARKGKSAVGMEEFNEGVERVTAGLEKKQRIINDDEKQRVAHHESGHALVAYSLPNTDPVHKVSIIPRGLAALGYMMQRPEGDRYLMTQGELESRIQVLLAGTLAEQMVFNDVSTGAQNDLERASEIARSMVMDYGMSRLGRINFRESTRSPFLSGSGEFPRERSHSEQTAREIDQEVRRIIDEAIENARQILATRRPALDALARRLMENEVIDAEELKQIIEDHSPSPQIVPGTATERKRPTAAEVAEAPAAEPRRAGEEA